MPRIFGIDFADLDIPLARRLQTLGVIYFFVEFAFVGPVVLLLLLFLTTTRFYWVSCIYLGWWIIGELSR